MDHSEHHNQSKSKLQTYLPLILVLLVIAALSIACQAFIGQFSWSLLMRFFMGFFFLIFGFFKILDWRGFVDAYQGYDVIAKRSRFYGYLYPLIELTLGVLFLFNLVPFLASGATIIVMAVSSIGVIQTVLKHGHIQCACLGVLIKLPMSTITIIEDVGMGVMGLIMLLLELNVV